VAARLVSVGEYVREGTPLFRLVDDSVVKLRAAVPERYARDVRTGQSVSVEVAAYPDEKFLGQVSRINPQVDQASRTFGVEILVPNRDRKLKSGAFARASIEVRVDHGVLCVPQESIVSFAGEQKVFRVADGKAVQYGIETGEHLQLRRGDRVEEWVEVRSGLAGLDPVVVSGMSKLATGVAVTVRRPETRPASRSPSGPADAP
jgi:membrane fusion protein (multidrug efflux system)